MHLANQHWMSDAHSLEDCLLVDCNQSPLFSGVLSLLMRFEDCNRLCNNAGSSVTPCSHIAGYKHIYAMIGQLNHQTMYIHKGSSCSQAPCSTVIASCCAAAVARSSAADTQHGSNLKVICTVRNVTFTLMTTGATTCHY